MSGEKPIAITGGTGFVGQAVLDIADERMQPVEALARKHSDRQHARVKWVMGDLDNQKALDQLAAGARAISRCCAFPLPRR